MLHIGSDAAEVLPRHGAEMVDPRAEVPRVVGGGDEVQQVGLVATLIALQIEEASKIAGGAVERRIDRRSECKIHVPEERQCPSVTGPEIYHEVMRIIEGVGVDQADERLIGHGPQPHVHIHEPFGFLLQGGS